MKHKRFSKLLVGMGMMLSLGAISLTSCALFEEESVGFSITDVSWREDTDTHNIIVSVSTTDEENPTIVFSIPSGKQGEDGVGIKNVTSSLSEDKSTLTIIISYTDPTKADTIMSLPMLKGEEGRGIERVNVSNDEAGNIILQFIYTDGTYSKPISIPKGIDGLDGVNGVGIESFNVDESNPNYVKITITFSDNAITPKVITLPKGEDGLSITSINYDPAKSNDKEYAVTITYNDGHKDTFKLPRPESSVWHHGPHDPEVSLGKDNDFYLNVANGFVYVKENGTWRFVFSMDGTGSALQYIVTFHPSEGTNWINPQLIPEADYVLPPVKHGSYISLDMFPKIERSGYNFKGWYTTKEDNPNGGHFTDLTPILKDMDLYPHWELIA